MFMSTFELCSFNMLSLFLQFHSHRTAPHSSLSLSSFLVRAQSAVLREVSEWKHWKRLEALPGEAREQIKIHAPQ
jgi:hypothetical protein